jgi:hypothetical protein
MFRMEQNIYSEGFDWYDLYEFTFMHISIKYLKNKNACHEKST